MVENENRIIESGIEWFHGAVPERHLRHQLYTVTGNARRIYVNDDQTYEYLQSIVCRNIINVVNYQGPDFQRLRDLFPYVNALCVQHMRDKQDKCMVYRARLLQEWMYSILRTHEPMRVGIYDIPSTHYYLALLNNKVRRRNVQSGCGMSRDVVDWYPRFKNVEITDDANDGDDEDEEEGVPSDAKSESTLVTAVEEEVFESDKQPLVSSTPKSNNNFFSCCTS